MSHDAVRAFYKKLSESTALANSYKELTAGWLGHDDSKIVSFAASHGCVFTKSELAFVRLTNVLVSGGKFMFSKGSNGSVEDEVDYEPTLHPKQPFSPTAFYEAHNRHVDGMPKEITVPAPPESGIKHQMQDGSCTVCGCSETYIETHHPSCRRVVSI